MSDKTHGEVVKMAQRACIKGIECNKCAFDYLCDIQNTCEMLYDAGCRLPEENKDGSPCCHNCEYFAAFREPRVYEEGITVYGECFKNYTPNTPYTYPIYVPGGTCKQHKQASTLKDGCP